MNTSTNDAPVVVGVDGSRSSDTALLWAAAHAESTGRPLHVVHALGVLTPGELVDAGTARELRIKDGDQLLHDAAVLAGRAAPGTRVETRAEDGDPRQVLLSASESAAIVVVGTRGRGPLAALALGSVSVAVAGHAASTVAVVRPRQAAFDDVVVGVAGDGSDQAAIRLAAELASRRGVDLYAVHAWSNHDTFVDTQHYEQRLEMTDEHERVTAEALAGVADAFPDLRVHVEYPDRGAVRGLVDRSRTADCLVLGKHGKHGLAATLGSVSRATVERARCTVLVVPSVADERSS